MPSTRSSTTWTRGWAATGSTTRPSCSHTVSSSSPTLDSGCPSIRHSGRAGRRRRLPRRDRRHGLLPGVDRGPRPARSVRSRLRVRGAWVASVGFVRRMLRTGLLVDVFLHSGNAPDSSSRPRDGSLFCELAEQRRMPSSTPGRSVGSSTSALTTVRGCSPEHVRPLARDPAGGDGVGGSTRPASTSTRAERDVAAAHRVGPR